MFSPKNITFNISRVISAHVVTMTVGSVAVSGSGFGRGGGVSGGDDDTAMLNRCLLFVVSAFLLCIFLAMTFEILRMQKLSNELKSNLTIEG